jgi:raffinose/stachyose/melibiose transport system permease protein
MDKYLRKRTTILFFLLPALVVYIVTVFVPIIWSGVYSFFAWDGISEMTFTGWDNYIRMFTNDDVFWSTVLNTIIYTIFNIIMQVFGGLCLAILLFKITKGRGLFQTLFYAPVVLSTVAIAQIFTKIYSVNPVGLLNQVLSFVTQRTVEIEWLINPKVALLATAFVEGYKYAGIYMVILYSALASIPKDVEEAGMIDGASGWKCYRYIKFPLIKNVIITCIVLVLNGSLKAFDIPYLLTYGGPGHTTELVATYMYKQAFGSMFYGYGSAIAIFIVLECFLLVVAIRGIYQVKEGV